MRASERLAAGVVAVMTVPALLAFPALGIWYAARVWPAMSPIDRGLFCCGLALLIVGTPYRFRRGMQRIIDGDAVSLKPLDIVVFHGSIVMGAWALTHRVDTIAFLSVWTVYSLYKARKNPERCRLCKRSTVASRDEVGSRPKAPLS